MISKKIISKNIHQDLNIYKKNLLRFMRLINLFQKNELTNISFSKFLIIRCNYFEKKIYKI